MRFIDANYVEYSPNKWLTYDDVLLMPRFSRLTSRNDPKINLQTNLTAGIKMNIPIISANMDTVTEADMAIAMAKQGGCGIIHKYYGDTRKQDWLDDLKRIREVTEFPAFSIGLSAQDINIVGEALGIVGKAIVCIDVAHGETERMYNQVRKLSLAYPGYVHIIAGNVATPNGARLMVEAGAHAIKVGVGPGSLCSTRIVTGHGVPQLSTIMSIRRGLHGMQSNASIIADGGIRNSGDIVKALAAGADSVMIGKLFAGCEEAPSKLYYKDDNNNYFEADNVEDYYRTTGNLYQKYRGQSSAEFNKEIGKENVTPEGESTYVPAIGPVSNMLSELLGGIRSGMSYTGAFNLKELYNYATFMEISHHAYLEGTPHGVEN